MNGVYYKVTGAKVGEGVHCQVYLETGKTVDRAVIDSIVNEFDNTIYPANTMNFGSEPNPGIDKDQKIYILLLDIKDGYDPVTSPSYVAGYFDPSNEYLASLAPYSNQKEIFYMDIFPAVPGSSRFFTTLAHEFQHMIHWQQEEVFKNSSSDDVWLNEAMSEVAPVYCGYGPSYSRVATFEYYPDDSLTLWGDSIVDYGVAYMWGQYFKDHFGEYNIFRAMLQNSAVGTASVNAALSEVSTAMGLSSTLTFTSTFHDWAIALYSGNTITWAGNPRWSYTSINTWPGTYNGVALPGLFPASNVSALQTLAESSVAFYRYTPLAGVTGTLTWSGGTGSVKAALADETPVIFPDLQTGQSYTYLTNGYLILSNSSSAPASGGTATRSSMLPYIDASLEVPGSLKTPVATASPKAMLERANSDPVLKRRVAETGEPEPLCIHSYMKEKEKPIREKARKLRGRNHD